MRWPWKTPTQDPLDRVLAIMDRRMLEDQEVKGIERDAVLNEMHRRLLAEEYDDPFLRMRAEARVEAARSQGWVPWAER